MDTDIILCSICHINPIKYTCPACLTKTCSLQCVKRHKKQTECTGKPNITKYIPKNELSSTNVHLNRDYNFLLNVDRTIQLAKDDIKTNAKNLFKRPYHQQRPNTTQKRFKKASDNATQQEDKRIASIHGVFPNDPPTVIKRHNTLIIQLPPGMHRSSSNKTGYDKKLGMFVWTIEWIHLDLDRKEVAKFVSYRLKEALSLRDAVCMSNLLKGVEDKTSLRFYLLNVINNPNGSVIELDPESNISDSLKDKILLEYATIYVTTDEKVLADRVVSEKLAYGLEVEVESTSDSDSTGSDSSSDESSSDSSSSDEEEEDESDSDSGPEEASLKPPGVIKFQDEDPPKLIEEINPEETASTTTTETTALQDVD